MMQLFIDGQPQEFTDIKTFRAAYGLPADFGVACFEPKDYSGLGRIDRAGAELNALRQAVLEAIPPAMPLRQWLTFLPQLGDVFLAKLREINRVIGLKDVEIEFAYAGFNDVCQTFLYAVLHARASGGDLPSFQRVYADWLHSTVRLSQTVHTYIHQGEVWRVQIANHAYGRIGLIVRTPWTTHYVRDAALACPAEGFMAALLSEAAARILAAP